MTSNDSAGQLPPDSDWALLTRFVAGEATSADEAAVARWLAQDPARGAELAELRRIWARTGMLPSDARLDGLWRDLQRRMHEEETPLLQPPVLQLLQPRRSPARRWLPTGLAVAGLASIAVGAVRWHWADRIMPGTLAVVSEQVYHADRGQRVAVQLADGSRVQLGPDSRIVVRLRDDRREVALEGEAVFEVVHDASRPFRVAARNAWIEDLGTTFGVRAYRYDPAIRVVVAAGQVALWHVGADARPDTAHGRMLVARDVGELDRSGTVSFRRDVDPGAYLAWTQDRLVFRETPLGEIGPWLERWYNVTITFADSSIAKQRLTLDLASPSLVEALDAIVVPAGLRYERIGRQVTVHR